METVNYYNRLKIIEIIDVECYFVVLNFNCILFEIFNIFYVIYKMYCSFEVFAHNIISASTITPFQFEYYI